MIVIHQVSCVKRRFPFRCGLMGVTYRWRAYITKGLFSVQCTLACTEMTINNKIRAPQVVLIVRLSWASNDITFGLKKLHLAVHALP